MKKYVLNLAKVNSDTNSLVKKNCKNYNKVFETFETQKFCFTTLKLVMI